MRTAFVRCQAVLEALRGGSSATPPRDIEAPAPLASADVEAHSAPLPRGRGARTGAATEE